MPGSASERVAAVTASARSLPALIYPIDETVVGKHDLDLPSEQIIERRPATTIGHVNHVDAGHHLEQLAGQMGRCPGSSRRIIDFARASLGIGDELGNRLSRDRWIYRHDKWCADNASDWRDIADEIVVELVVECRIDRVETTDQQKRVAVCGRAHD